MPKQEAPVPSGRAERKPYPRKNIYFAGPRMEEVYNYYSWLAHVHGHTTLDGKTARGMAAVVLDLLTRQYLDDMRDEAVFRAFTAWCDEQRPAIRRPQPLLLALSKLLRLLPKRTWLPGTLREWQFSSKECRDLQGVCDALKTHAGVARTERTEEAS